MRLARLGAVAALLVTLTVGITALSSAAATQPTIVETVAFGGGATTLTASVHRADRCTWTSTPKLAHFDTKLNCRSGKVRRIARLESNTSQAPMTYHFTLVVAGKVRQVHRWTIEVAAHASAYLDPTFVQSPTNPLKVTWCASVSDDAGTSPCSYNNGTTAPVAATEDPTLASGVLDFYVAPAGASAGLVCSTDVGPSLNFADCTVNVSQGGAYTVITEFLSGSIDSSATETGTIGEVSTTSSLTVEPTALPSYSSSSSDPCTSVNNPTGKEGTFMVSGATDYCAAWNLQGTFLGPAGTAPAAVGDRYTVSYQGASLTTYPSVFGSDDDCPIVMSAEEGPQNSIPAGEWQITVFPNGCASGPETSFTVTTTESPADLVGPTAFASYNASMQTGWGGSTSTGQVLSMLA